MKKKFLSLIALNALFILASCDPIIDPSITTTDSTTTDTGTDTITDTSSSDNTSDTTGDDNQFLTNIDELLVKENIEDHLAYLTSPEIGGRASGSATNLIASHYVADHFQSLELTPYQENGSYFQPYMQDHTRIFNNYFSFEMSNVSKTTTKKYRYSYDFTFFYAFTGSGYIFSPRAFEAQTTLVLYETNSSLDYQDKIVLVNTLTLNILDELKTKNAQGIIIKDRLETYPAIEFGQGDMFDETDFLLLYAHEDTVDALTKGINNNLNNISISYEIDNERKEVNNIIGILDVDASQNLIISAHIDHLGRFDEEEGGYYAGALDNASGLSSMLEIARVLSEQKDKLTKNIIFIAYNGEEAGLFGSKYYSQNMIGTVSETRAQINIDMVGGAENYVLEVYGNYGSTTKSLRGFMDDYNIENYILEANHAVSDHYYLANKRMVSLSFVHFDDRFYHTPLDTYDKIDFDVLINQISMISRFLLTTFNK